jgi:hypothetical protein|tara:strand:- start:91 stop:471 length:381 start_codon:yes stop_codon:yes gene_type:complete
VAGAATGASTGAATGTSTGAATGAFGFGLAFYVIATTKSPSLRLYVSAVPSTVGPSFSFCNVSYKTFPYAINFKVSAGIACSFSIASLIYCVVQLDSIANGNYFPFNVLTMMLKLILFLYFLFYFG